MKKSSSPTSYELIDPDENVVIKTEYPQVIAYLVSGLEAWVSADWLVCDDNGSYQADQWLQDNRASLVADLGDIVKVNDKGPFIFAGMAGLYPLGDRVKQIEKIVASANCFQLLKCPYRDQPMIEMDLCDVPHISIIKQ